MGFRTEVGPMDNADTEATAARLLRENALMTQKLRSQLPKNRDLLRKIQRTRAAAHLDEFKMTHIVVLNNHDAPHRARASRGGREIRRQSALRASRGHASFPCCVPHYPILFSKDADTGAFFCGAMLGIDEGENLFLKEGGAGHEGYRPLNLQRGAVLRRGR